MSHNRYNIKILFSGLIFFFYIAPMLCHSQSSIGSVPQLPTEILFASIDLYQQKQISEDELQHRITALQKKYLWHVDQIKYLKDFYRRASQSNTKWTFPYCQVISLFKTDFYLDYSDTLDICTQWPRVHLDLNSFQRNVSLLGVRLNATQLQEAEIYEQDYAIREVTAEKIIVSVGPVQEFLARQMSPTNDELAQPLRQYTKDFSPKHMSELPSEKMFQYKEKQNGVSHRNKYLVWGLALISGLAAYQYVQSHSFTIQY